MLWKKSIGHQHWDNWTLSVVMVAFFTLHIFIFSSVKLNISGDMWAGLIAERSLKLIMANETFKCL